MVNAVTTVLLMFLLALVCGAAALGLYALYVTVRIYALDLDAKAASDTFGSVNTNGKRHG
jgi:hypothetical protein